MNVSGYNNIYYSRNSNDTVLGLFYVDLKVKHQNYSVGNSLTFAGSAMGQMSYLHFQMISITILRHERKVELSDYNSG